jgi:uncharacterized protein (TIGR02246 family)
MATSDVDDVRAVLDRISEAWQTRRYEDLSRLLAQDMVFALPGLTARLEGRDAIVASYREFMDRITLTSYREDEHSINVWGGMAVASFRWDMAWLAGGVPNHEIGRDIFAFRHAGDAGWIAVWRTMLLEPKRP